MDSKRINNHGCNCYNVVVMDCADEEMASSSQSYVTEQHTNKLQHCCEARDSHCCKSRESANKKVKTQMQEASFLCKYFPLGCQFQGTQHEMEKHEGEKIHNDLLIKCLLNMQTEQINNSSMTAHSFNQILSFKNTLTTDKDQLKALIDKKDEKIESLKEAIKNIEIKNQKLEEIMMKYDENIKKQNETLLELNNKIEKLTVNNTKLKSCCGELLQLGDDFEACENELETFKYFWKIKKFTKLQKFAKTDEKKSVIFSPPFYTSECGYQMRVLLYPNGDRDGLGTHLSVFLQVSKGKYDGLLKWPIDYSAKIRILDQCPKKDHYCVTLTSDAEQKSVFGKPEKPRNTGWGYQKLIPFDELNYYLADDSFLLEIELNITSEEQD